MNNDNNNDRRNFLKTAGAALVAVSLPVAAVAQNARPGGSINNLKQMGIACHAFLPDSRLPGVFGQASYQFQMIANLDGSGGYGTISDPVFTEINSHIEIRSSSRDVNDMYIFQGTVSVSNSSQLMGKEVVVKVQVLSDGNCDVYLTIGDTPVQGLLLPAVQKVRDAARRTQ